MRPQIVTLLTSALYLFSSASMLAQLSSGGSGPPPPPPTPPPELPLDAGISILIVLGIVYGCYVIIKKKRRLNTFS